MKNTALNVGTLDAFFEEGRQTARRADGGKPIPEVHTIKYENLEDLLEYLTPKRVALFKAIKASAKPASITTMAHRLGRGRAAVKRDIDALRLLGIVDVEDATLPGHGRQKLVRPVAQKIVLSAML